MGEPEKQAIAASLKPPRRCRKVTRVQSLGLQVDQILFPRSTQTGIARNAQSEASRRGRAACRSTSSDFARVPLLNPDQLVSSWREKLPPLDNEYDTRMVMLGKRDPGRLPGRSCQRRSSRLHGRRSHRSDDDHQGCARRRDARLRRRSQVRRAARGRRSRDRERRRSVAKGQDRRERNPEDPN